jgi:hypothetical protein
MGGRGEVFRGEEMGRESSQARMKTSATCGTIALP